MSEIFNLSDLLKEEKKEEEKEEKQESWDLDKLNKLLENINKLFENFHKYKNPNITINKQNNTITLTKRKLAETIVNFSTYFLNNIPEEVTVKELKEKLKEEREKLISFLENQF